MFVLAFTSFGLTALFGFAALTFFPRWGLLDKPHKYGLERAAIPYPGGVALLLGMLFTGLIFLKETPLLLSLFTATTLLAVTCFWDDRRGLSPKLRLVVQGLAAALLVLGGLGINSITNPLGGTIVLDSWNIPLHLGDFTFTFTVFADVLTAMWLVTMTNAFNWIDGVPGMVSSVSAVTSFVLLMLSTRAGFHSVDQSLAIDLSSLVLGASLAFLLFDFPSPRMLMGDTGSMTLGFLLAVTALISGGKVATTALVLGFPLLDFLWVIGRRLWNGQSPFKGDLGHFHHRLQRAGYSERAVVIFFALTAGLFGALALMLHTEGKALALIGILVTMLLLSVLLYSKK